MSAPAFQQIADFDSKRNTKFLWKTLKHSVLAQMLDMDFILDFLVTYNREQRMALVRNLEFEYDYKLVEKVLRQPESDIRSCTLAMILEPIEIYVRDFRDLLLLKSNQILNFGISRKLVEILLTLSNNDIVKFKETYEIIFQRSAIKDIEVTYGKHSIMSRLLTQLIEGKRSEQSDISVTNAKMIAKKISESDTGIPGIDIDTFITMFTQDSFAQLSTMFDVYEDKYERTIEEAIQDVLQGQIEAECFQDIAVYTRSPCGYLAKALRQALDTAPIDFTTLKRIIIGHEGKDLREVSLEYCKLYDETLDKSIQTRIDIDEIKHVFITIIQTREDFASNNVQQNTLQPRNNSSPFATGSNTLNDSTMGVLTQRSLGTIGKWIQKLKSKNSN